MTVRVAEEKDLDGLCAMAKRFVGETELPLTYSEELSRKTFWQLIQRPGNSILLVWEEDDVLGGLVVGMVERDFCNEYGGFVLKFYVEKELRGLGVSQEMLERFEHEAVTKGATVLFASSTAGMGETVEKLYVRLFEKQGYNVLGRVLIKECK